MALALFLFMFGGLILIVLVWGSKKSSSTKKDALSVISSNGYKLDKVTHGPLGFIGFDKAKETLFLHIPTQTKLLINSDFKIIYYKFSEIMDCELEVDNETVFKKSGTIGGALVGGALFGGVGAIVGGLSGGGKSTSKVKEIKLRIITRDIENPNAYFVFLSGANPIKNLKMEAALEWKDIISIIIDRNKKAPDKSEANITGI